MQEAIRHEPLECVQESFPDTWFYPKWRLVCSFPQGVVDEPRAAQFIKYLEFEERHQKAPFDRYIDLSGVTALRLGVDFLIQTARHRRGVRQPVKTALVASETFAYRMAQTYEMLMDKAMIEVRAFRDRMAAARWLEMPVEILRPPKLDDSALSAGIPG